MGCGCNDPITNWYALENHVPKSPFNIVEYAELGGQLGTFEYSSDYLTGGTALLTTPISVAGTPGGVVEAWEGDNLQKVGDATMWTQQHKMTNTSNDVPPALHKMVFMRGGKAWKNTIPLDLGVAVDYVLLSFLENGGTRGDAQGQVPVIRFEALPAGQHLLTLTLRHYGEMSMGLATKATASGDKAMMEMDWVIVR